MRVLRNGNRMYIMAYCQRCGCLFEEERKKWYILQDANGDYDYISKCPQCFADVTIPSENVNTYPNPANEDPWEEE